MSAKFSEPASYRSLQSFHKYWGKKPSDFLAQIVSSFCPEHGRVLDPFLGYGSIARVCTSLHRGFVGFDINPVAVKLAAFASAPPAAPAVAAAFGEIRAAGRERILDSYALEGGRGHASHLLWDREKIIEVWSRDRLRSKVVRAPTEHDEAQAACHARYRPMLIRDVKFFRNSRINTAEDMSLPDLFTGRALRNIEILLAAIRAIEDVQIRDALLLALTSASGQMSKMVFAITHRGKTAGRAPGRAEVGSWAIGYWRPKVHFEVNVWDCFERRARKIINACAESSADAGLFGGAPECQPQLRQIDCLDGLAALASDSVDLIVTDPPHGDRIPYLELSEMWNAILGIDADFDREIVISDAKGRDKNYTEYFEGMRKALVQCRRVLKKSGILILIFNSRKSADWEVMQNAAGECPATRERVTFMGRFDCAYSAGSIAQDNRKGGLKYDFGLVFAKSENGAFRGNARDALEALPNWSPDWPAPESIAA